MHPDSRTLVEAHWRTANARDWPAFAALLAPALQYDVPQTRERIRGGEGYLDMFKTWPGQWRAETRQLICDDASAVSVIDFIDGAEVMTGISIFRFDAGLITHVTDYWPNSYEPPPRVTPYLERY